MANNDKTLVRFNIKNAKYAVLTNGTYGTPVALGYADSIALEANYAEKIIYGDGRAVLTIPNDKGKTGDLALLTIDDAYEIAMKRRMKTAKGTAEIKQLAAIEHAIYFEFDYMEEDGEMKTAKTVLYGVTSGRPSETFSQTTEDINNNNISYPLTIKGIKMQTSDGKDYTDDKGNIIYAWQETSLPGDTGYEEFGKTIVAPQAPASAAATSVEGEDPLTM